MASPTACHWHADRETGLRCGNCGKPVCFECVRQHPVGIRCKECARAVRLPTYRFSRSDAGRGIGAAVVLGLVGALVVVLVTGLLAGFFFFALMIGLGYVIGEGVGRAVNRRRGRAYQYMALGAVLLATSPLSLPALGSFSIGSGLLLLGVGAAALVAWHRLAP
ncbi:MAG: hypothetical protein IIC95_01575 [Chloroflexi bacterium]|nr:hypothetical protein [Chloroflexota bacterium]MCH7654659.1 hypothetical protein [Chloroflexota bacterium]